MRWRYEENLLIVCTLGFFATMGARLVISPVIPDIITEFDVSSGAIGLAITGMWLLYGFSQFPAGLLGDTIGERTLIVASLLFTAVCSIALAVSPNFVIFILAAIVLGLAAGFHYVPSVSLLTKQYANTGRAMGVFITGGSLGGLLVPPAAVYVALHFGWRAAIAFGAAVALPVLGLSAWYIRPTDRDLSGPSVREKVVPTEMIATLTRPDIAFMTALGVLGMFVWQATATFLPLFLVEYHAVSQAIASIIFSVYFGLLAVSQPILGEFSERYGRDLALVIELGGGATGFILLLFGDSLPLILSAIVLIAMAMSFGGPLQARFMDRLSDAERGTNFGLARTVFMMFGSLGNVIVGTVADLFSWFFAFGLLAVLSAVVVASIVANRAFDLGM